MRDNKAILIFCLFALCLLGGCKKKSGTLTLQFKGMYGNESFALDSIYTDPSGRFFQPTKLMFYLSNVNLIGANNSQRILDSVLFVNFSDPSTLTYKFDDVSGNFTGISWGCGLDSVQSLTNPNYASGVLGGNDANLMYWGMGGLTYRFEVLEAYWDTVMPANNNFTMALGYHIGTDALYRYTNLSSNFSIGSGGDYVFTINIDVKKLFYGSTGTLDISNPAQQLWMATPQDSATTGTIFVGNFSQAFSN